MSQTTRKKERKRVPYGFDIEGNCATCQLSTEGFYCQLPVATLNDFNAIQSIVLYPRNALLFLEGQISDGIFMVCSGQVKVSTSISESKSLIVGLAKAGELLGLMAVLGNTKYEVTAETYRPCQIAYIRSEDFLRFVSDHPDAYTSIIGQFRTMYERIFKRLRNVTSSKAAHKRIGRLLLEWSDETEVGRRVIVPFNQEEIGEIIGTSREAVNRALGRLIDQNLVVRSGPSLMIPDRAALESLVAD